MNDIHDAAPHSPFRRASFVEAVGWLILGAAAVVGETALGLALLHHGDVSGRVAEWLGFVIEAGIAYLAYRRSTACLFAFLSGSAMLTLGVVVWWFYMLSRPDAFTF